MIHSFNRFTHYSLFFRFESLVIPWGPPLTRTPLYLCSEVTPGKTPRLLVEAQVTLLQQRRTHRSELLLQRWNKAETTGGERNSLQGLTAFVVSADRERAAKVWSLLCENLEKFAPHDFTNTVENCHTTFTYFFLTLAPVHPLSRR